MQKNQKLNSGKKIYGENRFDFFEIWICHNFPTVWNFLTPIASNWPSVKSRIVVRRKIKSDKFYCHFLKIFKNFPEISRNFDVLRFLASRPNQGVFQRTDCTSGVLKLFLKGLLGQKKIFLISMEFAWYKVKLLINLSAGKYWKPFSLFRSQEHTNVVHTSWKRQATA